MVRGGFSSAKTHTTPEKFKKKGIIFKGVGRPEPLVFEYATATGIQDPSILIEGKSMLKPYSRTYGSLNHHISF